jgi:CRP/FNR family transcriptional regulator, cyclic AMP receptor protein
MSATANQERVPILTAALELTRHLTADERAELGNVGLPVFTIRPGPVELSALLAKHKAFGATVLDGLMMSAQQIGDHTGIQLLGPGDLLVHGIEPLPDWLSDLELRAPAPVRVAVFGNELLAAAYRWPRLIQGLYCCVSEQLQRLGAQLVICQLPRVDERVLAMMWLLAESWGQVTPGGVRLPLALTHETLGALVGARRPTVTLALRKLSREGAVVHQDNGWLLLEPPPQPEDGRSIIVAPEPVDQSISRWAPPPPAPVDPSVTYAELKDTLRHLREQHSHYRETTAEQLRRLKTSRVRMETVRERISRDAITRRRVPPSS